ncbi:glucose 1-dehydrogenase [Chloroflexota bacterium]
MTREFEGRVALVTGGASGIGRTSAIAFACKGAKVVVNDLDAKGGTETIKIINGNGGEAIFYEADVGESSDVEALIKTTTDTYGRLDFAHNNAGFEGVFASTSDYPEEIWNRVIKTNLKGVWLSMKYEIPQMLRCGGGSIVNTASTAGLVGFPQTIAYVASKHGIVGMTRSIALEYAGSGIRVNAVCPGGVNTPMKDRIIAMSPDLTQAAGNRSALGRSAEPEEIAQAVVWLCSQAASFITGHPLIIDGGYLAQ